MMSRFFLIVFLFFGQNTLKSADHSGPYYTVATTAFPVLSACLSASQLPQAIQIWRTGSGEDVTPLSAMMDSSANIFAILTAFAVDAPPAVWIPFLVPIGCNVLTLIAKYSVKYIRQKTTLILQNQGTEWILIDKDGQHLCSIAKSPDMESVTEEKYEKLDYRARTSFERLETEEELPLNSVQDMAWKIFLIQQNCDACQENMQNQKAVLMIGSKRYRCFIKIENETSV
jgi:hypothetical protein